MKNNIIQKLKSKIDLSEDEAYNLQSSIIKGEVENMVEIFEAFDAKNIVADELLGIVKATRNAMIEVDLNRDLLDNCGTGGDKLSTFNISTASALVCTAAGVPVAKHGNRSSSGKCGSADLLEALGVKIDMNEELVKKLFDETNFAFMFAPNFHPALRFVKEARKAYGKPTYFNLLGPMLNPAHATHQVIGIYDSSKMEMMARTLQNLGSKKVMMVHAEDGMDEISINSKTEIGIFTRSRNKCGMTKKTFSPEEFAMKTFPLEMITCDSKEECVNVFKNVLTNKANEAQMNAVILNSAAGLLTFGKVASFEEGILLADEILKSGRANEKLEEIIRVSNHL